MIKLTGKDGKTVEGSVVINCNTKHESLKQKIATRNLRVNLRGMPYDKFEQIFVGQMTVDLQNRKIRKAPVNEARGWTSKEVSWSDIYARSVTRRVVMSDEEILAKAKSDPEYRKRLLAELETM